MGLTEKRLRRAEGVTELNPTEKQKETGRYRQGKVILNGFSISIENPKGSKRSGIDENGKPWESELTCTYGYFMNTEGYDGDEVDVFIGPEIESNFDVYVIDQVDQKTRQFDEHKVMFGFASEGEAVKAYLSNYQEGWTGYSDITSFTLSDFRQWLNDEEKTKIPAKYQKTSTMDFKNTQIDEEKLNVIKLKGEVLVDETLNDLINQTGPIGPGETLALEIASPGGSVEEGLKIMMWLEELSQKGVQIITVVTANAYSIASLIMLAADIRLISRHGKVMVHNPMVPELSYVNANELEKHINSLRELEGFMYDLYQMFTGLERSQIKLLMDNETYLEPNEAVEKGFADMVVNIKETPYEMAGKPEKTVNMKNTVNVLKHLIAKVNGADVVNQLYYDNEGGAVEVYQADPSQYQIGDRTSVGEGEVQLANGSVLVIKEGVIEDIKQAEIVQPMEETPAEAPVVEEEVPSIEEVAQPEASVEEVVETMEEHPAVAPVAPEAPAAPVEKSKDAMPSSVIETTESTITTKETVAQEVKEEPVAEVVEEVVAGEFNEGEAPKEMVKEEMVSLSAFKALEEKVEALVAKNEMMEKDIMNKLSEGEMFQSTAAEAIETLAKNTVSGFAPEARVSAKEDFNFGKNSIFQKAKRKAGLA